jgi:hypothetical protein
MNPSPNQRQLEASLLPLPHPQSVRSGILKKIRHRTGLISAGRLASPAFQASIPQISFQPTLMNTRPRDWLREQVTPSKLRLRTQLLQRRPRSTGPPAHGTKPTLVAQRITNRHRSSPHGLKRSANSNLLLRYDRVPQNSRPLSHLSELLSWALTFQRRLEVPT